MGSMSDDLAHEGAIGYVLDSVETEPVVDVHIGGKALADVEGFRVVGWAALRTCGWSGPIATRSQERDINPHEGIDPRFSVDDEAPVWAEGCRQGTWDMRASGAAA